jgi:hypothetical protein
MEGVLTDVSDPNVILEKITSKQNYLSVKHPEKTVEETLVRRQPKAEKPKSANSYNDYSDFTRETFIDRMLEQPLERGLVTKVAKDLNINYRTALRL